MLEHTHWHPVADAQSVKAQPVAAQLLGQDIVLWRDHAGLLHAWADQCPHRGAKLSLGRVVHRVASLGDSGSGTLAQASSHLECAYHGWQFDAAGQCQTVPALPAFAPPPGHCARVYAAREAFGLAWVRLKGQGLSGEPVYQDGAFGQPTGSQALPELPAFDAETDRELRKTNCGPYEVAASAPRIVENFLDMAHFGFIHDGWLGSRDAVIVENYDIAQHSQGFVATNCIAYQPKSSLHATGLARVEYRYEVNAPYAAILTKVPESAAVAVAGFRESIALFVCPVTPVTSRVWFRLAMNDFASTDAQMQAFQDTIFQQDKPILESQTPKLLPLDPLAERHTAADKSSAAYRRFLRDSGIVFGTC